MVETIPKERKERQFRLFFVVTNNNDLRLLNEVGWKNFMWSMEYVNKIDISKFPKDAYIMLDNGYFTKFGKRLAKNEVIRLEEKVEHSEKILQEYLRVTESLRNMGIENFYVFDFDYFASTGEERKYREEYLKKLIALIGREHIFAVYHSGDEEWVKYVAERYGIDKLAIGSSEKDYPPYDFRGMGYKWIHWFGRFDEQVLAEAVNGRVDSADISSWNSPTRFGVLMKFEMGTFRNERVSIEAKTNPDEVIKQQINEYAMAVNYIDEQMNVEIKALDKFYCDVCPIKDRCPYYEPGGVCYVHRNEELTKVGNFEEELIQMAREIKEKYRYEELRVKAMGMPASAMELRLRDMFIKIMDKIETVRLKKMELEKQRGSDEEIKAMLEKIEEMFGE